jgi:hypothetical protein
VLAHLAGFVGKGRGGADDHREHGPEDGSPPDPQEHLVLLLLWHACVPVHRFS